MEWLNEHKVQKLRSLATKAGCPLRSGLKRPDVIADLNNYLLEHQAKLAENKDFKDFYQQAQLESVALESYTPKPKPEATPRVTRKRTRGTVKKEESVSQEETDTPLVKTEDDEDEDETAAAEKRVAQTPRHVACVAVPIPPSPAVVTDAIERQTAIVKDKVGHAWANSGITDTVHYVRELLSSAVGVESVVLLVEAYYMQKQIFPWSHAVVPAFDALGSEAFLVQLPDLFVLLTGSFWSPSLLWASTSLFVPLAVAYVFNITTKASRTRGGPKQTVYKADPLIFNMAKALVSYMVYARGVRFADLPTDETALIVTDALPGGHTGVLIGAAIGAIVSLYEAVLSR